MTVGEVGVDPGECCASDVDCGFQSGEQDGVVDGVKSCCEVQKDEDGEVA